LVGLGLGPRSGLLDLGCGTGQLAQAVEPFLADDGRYHGTDLAAEAVAFCRRRFRRLNFSFGQNEPAGIAAPPRLRFDAAAAFSVFTHTYPDETLGLLRDLRRLLAPGGWAFADLFVSPLAERYAGHRGAVELNPALAVDLFAAAGFRGVEVQSEPWGQAARRAVYRPAPARARHRPGPT